MRGEWGASRVPRKVHTGQERPGASDKTSNAKTGQERILGSRHSKYKGPEHAS